MQKLNETIFQKPILEEISRDKLPEGVLCRVVYPICNIGERNANRRVYEKAVWDKVLGDSSLREKLDNRALFGHAEHPEQSQSDLQLTSHVIFEMWVNEEDNKVYQRLDVLDTPTGRIVDTLLRAGCNVGVSTRAEGDLEEAEDHDGSYSRVVPESYSYVTTDFTADPSTFGVLPMEVKRNVVTEVKKGLGKEFKEGEQKFAELILESMEFKEGIQKFRVKFVDSEDINDEVIVNASNKDDADKQVRSDYGPKSIYSIEPVEESKVDKRRTIEDIVKEELIKVGAIVECKGKKCKVIKIEETTVSIQIPGQEALEIDGSKEIDIIPNGTIVIIPDVIVPPEEGIDDKASEEEVHTREPLPPEKESEVEILTSEEKEEAEEVFGEEMEESKVDETKGSDLVSILRSEKGWAVAEQFQSIVDNPTPKGIDDAELNYNAIRIIYRFLVGRQDEESEELATVIKKWVDIGWGDPSVLEKISVEETKDIIAMYKAANLPAPDGKGEHTKAFHKLAIDVAKGYVKSGDTPKKALSKAYPTAMKQLGKGEAVKKVHQKNESKVLSSGCLETFLDNGDKVYILPDIDFSQGIESTIENALSAGYREFLYGELGTGEGISNSGRTKIWWGSDVQSYLPSKNESKVNEGIGVGDTIQIKDKEGNTTIVPKATVYDVDEDTEGNLAVEITDSNDEDKLEWYGENDYQIIPLEKANESKVNEEDSLPEDIVKYVTDHMKETGEHDERYSVKYKGRVFKSGDWSDMATQIRDWEEKKNLLGESKSISIIAKEIMELKIQEAGTRAERDRLVEMYEQVAGMNKTLEVKILLEKMKKIVSNNSNIISALRGKLEEKLLLAKNLYEKFILLKSEFKIDVSELKEAIIVTEEKHRKELNSIKEEHQKGLVDVKEKAAGKVNVAVKDAVNGFIKQFVKLRIEESGVTVDNNSQALLENCVSLEEVDNVLDEIRDITRRSALHSGLINEVKIVKEKLPIDSEQSHVDKTVGDILDRFNS